MAELEQHGSPKKLADQCRRFAAQEQSPITNSLKKLRQALDNVPADVIRTGPIDESERKVGKILSCHHVIALSTQPLSFKGIFDDIVNPDVYHNCTVMTLAKADGIKFVTPADRLEWQICYTSAVARPSQGTSNQRALSRELGSPGMRRFCKRM